MLDLAPETENRVQEYAARDGVDADAFINRLLERSVSAQPAPAMPDEKALALLATLQQWEKEDATDDDEELDRRDLAQAELQTNLDQFRQRAGMRPLFPGHG